MHEWKSGAGERFHTQTDHDGSLDITGDSVP